MLDVAEMHSDEPSRDSDGASLGAHPYSPLHLMVSIDLVPSVE